VLNIPIARPILQKYSKNTIKTKIASVSYTVLAAIASIASIVAVGGRISATVAR
jgi:hypothetical protein